MSDERWTDEERKAVADVIYANPLGGYAESEASEVADAILRVLPVVPASRLAEVEAQAKRDMVGWNECVADLQATVAERDRLQRERDQLARKVMQARSRAVAGDIARAALNPPKP